MYLFHFARIGPTERISMKLAGANHHHHEQIKFKWVHYGRNWNRTKRQVLDCVYGVRSVDDGR